MNEVKIFIVVTGLLINGMLFYLDYSKGAFHGIWPLKYVIVSLIFFGFHKLVKYSRKMSPDTWTSSYDSDLKLKHREKSIFQSASECPNCTKNTISVYHAYRVPQTCGECGVRFYAKRPLLAKIAVFGFFFTFAIMLYLKFRSCIPQEQIRNISYIIFGIFMPLMFYVSVMKPFLIRINSEKNNEND